jgi:23S rRNA pseudouridine1911/1915/1917 synthase
MPMLETIRTLTADRGDAGLRVDLVLRRHLTDVRAATRTRVQSWIDGGQVRINGRIVSRASARAAFGDAISVTLPAERSGRPSPGSDAGNGLESSPLDIVHEDDQLLAVNKPAGVVVHPTYKNTTGTLMSALRLYAREWPADQRPSLVGRLDKLTSGILIVAKTAAVHAALQRELGSDRSEKEYLAVVYGPVGAARGIIDLRLGFDGNDRRRMVASTAAALPSATTFVRVARAGGLALLRCRLVTGRRHQIRVHLAARGWPIVGDPVYLTPASNGTPRWSRIADAALAELVRTFPRQALHARRIAFMHPATGERLSLDAPLPEDIKILMAASGIDGALADRASE